MSEIIHPGPTVGAFFVGGIVGASLYGLTCSQGFVYYTRRQKDSPLVRYYVLIVWLVNTVAIFLMTHILYYYFITHYGNPMAFMNPIWSLVTLVLLTVPLYFNFASSVLADASVAAALLCLFRGTKSGNSRTNSFLGRLMLYTVNTGLLTAADSAVALITYASMPNNFIFLTPYLVLSHLYTNALLASMNERSKSKTDDPFVAVSLSTVSPSRFPGTSISGQQLEIPIHTVVESRVEGPEHEDNKEYPLGKSL
ncbi:hypothetical protein BD413DRAFT_609959 [Trametes elegans]|nr:hypothetical protein BD413DRAFT_609959 [Trametes elegans]